MRRLYVVELFAGTHAVSKALTKCVSNTLDVRMLSVDLDPKSNAAVAGDINKWNYKRDLKECSLCAWFTTVYRILAGEYDGHPRY